MVMLATSQTPLIDTALKDKQSFSSHLQVASTYQSANDMKSWKLIILGMIAIIMATNRKPKNLKS